MATRYAIWDKECNLYTPAGPVYSPEEWIAQYPWIDAVGAVPVCAAGLINGAYVGELSTMKQQSIQMGNTNFTDDMTSEEILDCIEAWEDFLNTPSGEPSAQERIAAALEYQNLLAE